MGEKLTLNKQAHCCVTDLTNNNQFGIRIVRKKYMYQRAKKSKVTTFAIAAVFVTIALIGCGNQQAKSVSEPEEEVTEVQDKPTESTFQIKGKVEGKPGGLVVLQKLENGQLTFIDSVRVDEKGRYELNGSSDAPRFFYVTVNSMKPPGVPVILENNKSVELNLNIGKFIETSIKGDDENERLKSLYDVYLGHNKKSFEFQERYGNVNPKTMTDSMRLAINMEYANLQNQMNSDVEEFVKETKGSAATYFAATYVVQKPPIDLLEAALSQLKKDAPDAWYTTKLETRINSIGALEIGGQAPEIALNSPDGKEIKLSSLQGKVVLIDFWASWCRPCRQENPNVVRMYQKYNDKGFEVYSVSLDNNGDRWKAAIVQDGLTWTHVSDLKGWKSSAAALYQVSGIPKTFLLDRKGRIIAKDLRGPALEAKLAEIFN